MVMQFRITAVTFFAGDTLSKLILAMPSFGDHKDLNKLLGECME